MVKSKLAVLILVNASILVAQSGERDPQGKVQLFVDTTSFHAYTLAGINNYIFNDKAKDQLGLGIRLAAELPEAINWSLEFGGRLPKHSKFQLNGSGGGVTVDNTSTNLRYSWWAIGLGYALRPANTFEMAIHLEGRGENLKVDGITYATVGGIITSYPAAQGVNFWRPWARISAEVTPFSGKGGWAPYFGADVSGALKNTRQDQVQLLSDSIHNDTTLKSMAPRWEASVYAGIRF